MTGHSGDMTGGPDIGFWALNLLLVAAAGYTIGVSGYRSADIIGRPPDPWPQAQACAAWPWWCYLHRPARALPVIWSSIS